MSIFSTPQKEYLAAWSARPYWFNWLAWNIRNPLAGLTGGLATDQLDAPTWNPKGGFWYLKHQSGLPFLSYRGRFIEGYTGWRPSGAFGLALRRANAKGY